ncbi:alcohol dehydrogenase [Bosea sp. (in: a-proteobacteria)]|jgi:alcohol dehydrogenase/propanol-preferring alcohol dehydrogenase|uniref:alcohol dehydrogenase n=1 Tax=Bosea sp. (in: a-proteobacteria) TaxID=1871050 RepID=UPI002DDCDEF5|nr:alcohol dehydrogenase [Bosea sp. (in: a-proteobacteria)]HEV2512125.1 alcohol dehydrogenase [Bosea sp. (in: a-proteobacteria)]
MRAWAVVENGAPLQCIEVIDEAPAGTQVLLEVTHCGVCHSDLHFWKGSYDLGGGNVLKLTDRGVTLPRAIGHEVVGRVVAKGPQADGVEIGDVRIVFPWLGCGDCARCRAGEDNLCDKPSAIGVIRHGGFADRVMSPHPRFLVDPGSVDPALAATFACSGITVYSAIKKIQPIAPDDPVVLVGAGGLGLAAISMLHAFGHRAITVVEIDARKRQAALDAGATAVVDGTPDGLSGRIVAAAGGQAKAAIDFVNASGTVPGVLDALARGGKLVLVGVAGGEIALSLASLIFRPRTIQGSATGSPQDLRDVVALAQSGRLAPIPITQMPKTQVNEAMAMLHRGEVTGRIVLTPPSA